MICTGYSLVTCTYMPSTLTVTVTRTLAAENDVDPDSLPPLTDYFDPEALEQFLESAAPPVQVSVEAYDHTLLIDGDKTVTVVDHPTCQ